MSTTIASVEEARVQVDKFVQSNQSMNEYFIVSGDNILPSRETME